MSLQDENAPLLDPPILPGQNPQNRLDTNSSPPGHSSKIPHSRNHAFKIAATIYSFVVLGLFTSSIGVMLPSISNHYGLNDLHVSSIFLVVPAGYVLGAQSNSLVHWYFGQRGIAVLGPLFHIVSSIGTAVHPPFPALLVAFAVMSMGTGWLDGSWCAYAAGMENANTISGLLHGGFSIGAATGPVIVGLITNKEGNNWWMWYYVLAGASVLQLTILFYAFKHENAAEYHRKESYIALETTASSPSREVFKHPATWVSSVFFLLYVGNETAISGWIVSFMSRARGASPYLSNLSSSGFWAGMALGRLALGRTTDRIGVRRATTIYLLSALFLQFIFAIVRSPITSIFLMALLGISMGPLFPSGIVLLTTLLPRELHVAAVSLVASLGQAGGAALPFGIGAFVQSLGIGVFKWVILIFTTASLGVWVAFAAMRPRSDVEDCTDIGQEGSREG